MVMVTAMMMTMTMTMMIVVVVFLLMHSLFLQLSRCPMQVMEAYTCGSRGRETSGRSTTSKCTMRRMWRLRSSTAVGFG